MAVSTFELLDIGGAGVEGLAVSLEVYTENLLFVPCLSRSIASCCQHPYQMASRFKFDRAVRQETAQVRGQLCTHPGLEPSASSNQQASFFPFLTFQKFRKNTDFLGVLSAGVKKTQGGRHQPAICGLKRRSDCGSLTHLPQAWKRLPHTRRNT